MLRPGIAPLVAVALTIGVGLVARTQDLDKPIWHDEVYTRVFATGHHSRDWIPALFTGRVTPRDEVLRFQRLDPDVGVGDTLAGLARDEPQHPPLYYLLARAWMGVFGDGLAALRVLSVLASLAALWAAAWLAREAFPGPGPPVGPHVVMLFAASPFMALYAQEAREYALWSVWILAASAALLRALRLDASEPSRARRAKAWALWAALCALGLYTSLSHVSVILAQIAFVAWRERVRVRRATISAALALTLAAALFLPWGLLVWQHREAFVASMDWSRVIVVPTSEVVATLGVNLSRPLLDLWPTIEGPLAIAAVALAVGLALAALVHLARRGPPSTRALFVALVVVPVGLLVVPDLAFGGIRSFSTRYLMPALAATLVAIGFLLASLPRPALRRAATTLVVGLALAGSLRTTADEVPWPRALSAGLPAVARAIDAAERPLVLGDRERHHPGNLHALATLVGPATDFLLLDFATRDALVERAAQGTWADTGLPDDRPIFVYAPVPQLLAALERARGAPAIRVHEDAHVSCWRLDPPARP
ncbi:MAG: glycosyltransferase family 39 protein [Deltaproteobacteria bacterium]|nr:glycosyltransferase family 39 protein [Deltaproteobacteria bacterium]